MCMKYFNLTQHCEEKVDTEWLYLLCIWKIPMTSDWLSFLFESNRNVSPFDLCLCHSISFKITISTVYSMDWITESFRMCLSLEDSNQNTKYANKCLYRSHWVDGPVGLLLKSLAILFGLKMASNKRRWKNNWTI